MKAKYWKQTIILLSSLLVDRKKMQWPTKTCIELKDGMSVYIWRRKETKKKNNREQEQKRIKT